MKRCIEVRKRKMMVNRVYRREQRPMTEKIEREKSRKMRIDEWKKKGKISILKERKKG